MSKVTLPLLLLIAFNASGCLFAPPSGGDDGNGEENNTTPVPVVDMSSPGDMGGEPEDLGMTDPVDPPDMVDEPDMDPVEPDMDDPPPPPMNIPADPPLMSEPGLAALSDNFEDSSTNDSWLRLSDEEGWAPRGHQLDIDEVEASTDNGYMHLVPFTTAWFRDQRGPLVFKEVTGNFVVLTRVRVTGLDGAGLPAFRFSLGGLMARVPKGDDFFAPEDWEQGQERYVFVGIGRGDDSRGDEYELETKITRPSVNGESDSNVTSHGADYDVTEMAQLALVRSDDRILAFFRPDIPGQQTSWSLVDRYNVPNLPERLQVGMVAYTNYDGTIDGLSTEEYNETALVEADADLDARFYFVHFRTVPRPLAEAIASGAGDDMLVDLLFPSPP